VAGRVVVGGRLDVGRRRRLGALRLVGGCGGAATASSPAAAHAHAQADHQGHGDRQTGSDGPVRRVPVFPLGHALLEHGQRLFRGPGARVAVRVVAVVGLAVPVNRFRALDGMAQTVQGHLVRFGPLDDAPAPAVGALLAGPEQPAGARNVEPGQTARDGQLGRVQVLDVVVLGHVQGDQVGHDAQRRVRLQVAAPELQRPQSDGAGQRPHVHVHRVCV